MSAALKPAAAEPSKSAAQRAYSYVKERLLNGRYASGTLLSENELARQLGISRTPVRQAFLQLEAEELLELYPRRGALVRPLSAADADDVLEARLLIETHCARRACGRGAQLAATLRESIDAQERALQDGGAGFIAADRAFHRAIVAANGNTILIHQYDALRDRQQRMLAAVLARDPAPRTSQYVQEHREIAAALERGDADAAAGLITEHVLGAYKGAPSPRF